MSSREKLVISLIVGLGFLIRIAGISIFPPSLNWDEVSHGWNAYSILKTGADEWGEFLPLANFRAYGDYPLAANLYLTVPSLAVFGVNEFAIRLPHAILGTATILAVFFLTKGFGLGRAVAILAALFVAVDPWTLFPSRAVFQSNVALFFITTGIAFFAHRKLRPIFLPLCVLFLGISAYSYHNARIFVPVFLVGIALLWRSEWREWFKKKRIYLLTSLVLLLFFFLPLVPIVLRPEGRARSPWVFIINQGAINRINEQRSSSELPELGKRILYNKATYFLNESAKNFLGYFSPEFLFLKGGTNFQFSVPNKGVIFPVNLPFFYLGIGLFFLFALRGKREYMLLLLWSVLGLIPAAITQGQYQVIRSTTILPIPQIAVALGLVFAWRLFRHPKLKSVKSVALVVYAILFLYFIEGYFTDYLVDYRKNYSWAWQYGYKEVVEYTKTNYDKYDKIIVTKKYGEPHEFFLFFWPWDPQKYREDPNLIRFFQSNWYWVDRFDKFYFVNDWDIPRTTGEDWRLESGGLISLEGRNLLITSPGNYPSGWQLLQTVNFLDGEPAFEIYEKVS